MSQVKSGLDNEIRTVIKTGKVVLGFKKSLRAIKLGKAKAVVMASKVPKEFDDDIRYYAKLSGIPVIKYPGTSTELGVVCGKPFPISTIAVIDLGESKLSEYSGGGGE